MLSDTTHRRTKAEMPEALDVKGKRARTRWVNPLGPEEPDAAGRDGAAAADDEAARGRASSPSQARATALGAKPR